MRCCIFSETMHCCRISLTAIPSLSLFHRQRNSLGIPRVPDKADSLNIDLPIYILASAEKAPCFQ